MIKKILLLLFFFSAQCFGVVLTVGYVAQTAQGTGDGLTSGNAASLANHNANTIPGGTITSGTACTIHLVGTFTTQLVAPVSGTSGNIITYLFDSGAKFSAPYWVGGGVLSAFVVNVKNYITVDGGTNGIIECTANGTALANQVECCGLFAFGSNLTIQNLTVRNIYQRTPFSADVLGGNMQGMDVGEGNNISVINCVLSGAGSLLAFEYSADYSNYLIDGCTFTDCNHALTVGTTSNNLTGLTIRNNSFDHTDYWNGYSGNHVDYIIIQNNTNNVGPTFTNTYIYNNYFGPNVGSTGTTAAIFWAMYDDSQNVNVRVYDNLFLLTTPSNWTNGFICLTGCTGGLIANNTMVSYNTAGPGTGAGSGIRLGGVFTATINLIIQNNITSQVGTVLGCGSSSTWPTNLTSNHNVFYDFQAGSGSFIGPGGAQGNLAYWQGQGYDLDAVTTTPNLNGSYYPVATSSAIGTGADQSAYFTVDKAGTAWAGGTGWGIGAYKAAAAGGAGGSTLTGKITITGKATIK